MIKKTKELLAAYWTLAGDVYPGAPTEVSPYPLRDRAEAASRAGWSGVGLILDDLEYSVEKYGVSGVKKILEDTGMKYFELEILMDWYLDGEPRVKSDRFRKRVIELGAELGMRNLKIGASPFDESPADFSRMTDAFAKLCEDVAKVGATVAIEFMPFSVIRNIGDALKIAEGANQPNGGLMVDHWHVARFGSPYSEVASIPARFIKGVELDDVAAEIKGTLLDDSTFNRQLCGEGAADCRAFVNALEQAGCDLPYYGVELISEPFRKLPLEQMAERAYVTTIAQFSAQPGAVA
ncbi:sugar phosphate isomerase/epimerase family protein [Burkholderia multivorans]|uniref:sugar phosphate isomerase/epimerase family protein n=1 Tax=Burkholderia multivorans TaxID=87883 RepID=UPI001C2236FB|nr:sugar phosphate isomerase/epimerase [Burkholderia multivorans]MBU9211022.1 sugar phosphate isomerase/epimerase [Burkholderia multivorans]MBU9297990.1 sugar phosphate isomerase/epimerase [Burkholderia multivorans]MBU9468696.1 sugar phosphate isomerase/epimerase [Burkholderia multivorans]MBY4670636.1 sugar phosphate isomerase/epimerase [Burkholderia multivorans]MCA8129676.1 sugar phosphate isomerase/epimerase [Burkholderia multivorans]